MHHRHSSGGSAIGICTHCLGARAGAAWVTWRPNGQPSAGTDGIRCPLLLSQHASAHLRRRAPLPSHTVSPALTAPGWRRKQQQGLHPDRARLRSHCLQPLRWNGFETQPSALSMHTSALAGIGWFGADPPGFCCFCQASSSRKPKAFWASGRVLCSPSSVVIAADPELAADAQLDPSLSDITALKPKLQRRAHAVARPPRPRLRRT